MDDVAQFKLHLIESGRRPNTVLWNIRNYSRVKRMVKGELTAKKVQAYYLELFEQGRSARYVNSITSTLKTYDKWKNTRKFKNLKWYKETRPEKATMSDEEIEAFLKLPPSQKGAKRKENYDKWTLYFTILAFSGMRTIEVASLTINQIDFGRNVFVLPTQVVKTKEPRLVPIAPNLKPLLEEYLKKIDGPYLFPAPRGGRYRGYPHVRDADWWANFNSRIVRLGIKRERLTPYSLRHSFITRMLSEDVNLFKVKKIVGHKKIETTAQYEHLVTKDIQKAMIKDPLSRKYSSPFVTLERIEEQLLAYNLQEDERFDYVKVKKAIANFMADLYDSLKTKERRNDAIKTIAIAG